MHRALKATTCLIFHGDCASCLYFLLRYHFPLCAQKSLKLPSCLRGKPLCDLVSQQTWPIISACHWEPFRGINRAAKLGGRGASSTYEWHGTKGHLEIVRCSRTHSLREIEIFPLARPSGSVPCKSAERREMGTRNCISVSLPLTFPPSSFFQMQSVSST